MIPEPTYDKAPPTPGVAGPLALVLTGDSAALDVIVHRVDRAAGAARERLVDTVGVAEEAMGHPLHPVLVDLPIGFWTSAVVLDLVGGRRSRVAARRLMGLGVASAIPAALSGLHDAGDRTKALDRRIVAIHAALNGAATLAFASSWRCRRRERWLRGVALGLVGAALASGGGALGGELAFGAVGRGVREAGQSGRSGPSGPSGAGGGTPAGNVPLDEDRSRGSGFEPTDVGGGDPADPLGGVDPATVDRWGSTGP